MCSKTLLVVVCSSLRSEPRGCRRSCLGAWYEGIHSQVDMCAQNQDLSRVPNMTWPALPGHWVPYESIVEQIWGHCAFRNHHCWLVSLYSTQFWVMITRLKLCWEGPFSFPVRQSGVVLGTIFSRTFHLEFLISLVLWSCVLLIEVRVSVRT